MPIFNLEIKKLFDERTLLKRQEKDLKERILTSVEQEIIPRLVREIIRKDLGSIPFKNAFLSEMIDGYSLGFEISPSQEDVYNLVNEALKEEYKKIEEEYGLRVSGFSPVMYFS